jgi:transposase
VKTTESGAGVPDPRRIVIRRGDHALALGVERRGQDRGIMLQRLADRLAGAGVPDPRRLVIGRSDHAHALGVERRGEHWAIMVQRLARRWVVERTLAWLNRNRRLAKDFEASTASAQTWVYVASVQLLI